MVNHQAAVLDATFAALADPTRRAILAQLAGRDASVSALAEPFTMSLPAVSKHLRVLERAGLIERRRLGRVRRVRLTPAPMRQAAGWIARYRRFWEAQLDQLVAYLETATPQEESPWPRPSPSGSPAPSPDHGSESSRRGRRRKR